MQRLFLQIFPIKFSKSQLPTPHNLDRNFAGNRYRKHPAFDSSALNRTQNKCLYLFQEGRRVSCDRRAALSRENSYKHPHSTSWGCFRGTTIIHWNLSLSTSQMQKQLLWDSSQWEENFCETARLNKVVFPRSSINKYKYKLINKYNIKKLSDWTVFAEGISTNKGCRRRAGGTGSPRHRFTRKAKNSLEGNGTLFHWETLFWEDDLPDFDSQSTSLIQSFLWLKKLQQSFKITKKFGSTNQTLNLTLQSCTVNNC